VAELVIDVDTHITEPPDTFTARVPARFRDLAPRMERVDGTDGWYVQGKPFGSVGLTAVAGWPQPFPDGPPTFDEVHPAAHDAAARLRYMDEAGIWAQVLYPNVAGFGSQRFLQMDDPELMLACVRAYNDFQRDWVEPDPRRFVTVASLPFWDVPAAVAEVQRAAATGHRAVLFTGEPHRFGMPVLGHPHWDPLWSAIEETGLPVSLHIGSGDMSGIFSPERQQFHGMASAYAFSSVAMFMGNGIQIADLALSGVLPRHPGLRFVSVESGIGFLPFLHEALDYSFLEAHGPRKQPHFEELPSFYVKRQVYACYWFEQIAPAKLLDDIGPDRVLFETDFPHPTCLYGNVREKIDASLAHVTPEVRRKVLWDNAAALYGVEGPSA
jgi:predicted TIM-barrel fold metal-dependent hydrolase